VKHQALLHHLGGKGCNAVLYTQGNRRHRTGTRCFSSRCYLFAYLDNHLVTMGLKGFNLGDLRHPVAWPSSLSQ